MKKLKVSFFFIFIFFLLLLFLYFWICKFINFDCYSNLLIYSSSFFNNLNHKIWHPWSLNDQVDQSQFSFLPAGRVKSKFQISNLVWNQEFHYPSASQRFLLLREREMSSRFLFVVLVILIFWKRHFVFALEKRNVFIRFAVWLRTTRLLWNI